MINRCYMTIIINKVFLVPLKSLTGNNCMRHTAAANRTQS